MINEFKKTITLNLVGYIVEGEAAITDWYDNDGSVKMNKFEIPLEGISSIEELNTKIKENLNDGGFGAQILKGAYVQVFGKYAGDDVCMTKKFLYEEYLCNEGYSLNDEEKETLFNNFYEF